MANERIAELIGKALQDGIVHPGYPERDVPPRPIALPFGHTAGRPKEMQDLLDGTVKLLGEAIVHLIETDGDSDIIGREEAAQMRQAISDAPPPIATPVHCRCDRKFTDPLAMLSISDTSRIVIDGPTLLRGLSKRDPKCPHKRVK